MIRRLFGFGRKAKQQVELAQLRFNQTIDTKLFDAAWADGAFMDDVRQSTLRGAHPAANLLFWSLLAFVICAIVWASLAPVAEFTQGMGQVIPSGRAQKLQSLEGGIISEILVREGQVVAVGDVLVRIDDTGFASSAEEKRARAHTLEVRVVMLQAELSGETPNFPTELRESAPEIVAAMQEQAQTRRQNRSSALDVAQRQVDQRRQEIRETIKRRDQAQRSWELAKEEYELARPLEAEGVISKVELLRLEREVNDLFGERETSRLAVPRAESALQEAQARYQETKTGLDSAAQEELAQAKDELNRLEELLKADVDRVDRTAIRAPVRSQVQRVLVNTIGGVVQPGVDIVELIPLDNTLLVEARIRPQDIAFLRPGQPAKVNITAYDPTVYGSLSAELEFISADTITDENGESFYKIRVRTEQGMLRGKGGEPLPIISGMVATVDILTGSKTVLDYLLKPIRKAQQSALRER